MKHSGEYEQLCLNFINVYGKYGLNNRRFYVFGDKQWDKPNENPI